MRFHIRHRLQYVYDRPVFLEPQTLRLRPFEQPAQRLLRYERRIEPVPLAVVEAVDPEGTVSAILRFADTLPALRIELDMEVEVRRENPFDFVLLPGCESLPMTYPPPLSEALGAIWAPPPEAVRSLAAAVRERAADPVGFCSALAAELPERIERIERLTGAPWEPTETLARGEGSCRDLSVLYMAVCRAQGLAARFVSGYHEGDADVAEKDLHAWVEVYLPGGGWRGFDPSLGLAVADAHVGVAAGPVPALAAPLSGHFRGTGARSEMTASITMTRADGA